MNVKTLAIVTDAWWPQVNGVVNTLMQTRTALTVLGYQVTLLTPQDHATLPCPGYPEIRLALRPSRKLQARLDELRPDHIHIATEGPLGLAARAWCLRKGLAFTTSYHTRFPEYLRKRLPVPLAVSYAFLRRFHQAAARTMVATPARKRCCDAGASATIVRLDARRRHRTVLPEDRAPLDVARPLFLRRAGRGGKNLEAFLSLDLPGTKCVIGDGPALRDLRRRYPQTLFRVTSSGKTSPASPPPMCSSFRSPPITSGLVMLEAMACGVPVAAFPVTGPVGVVTHGVTGILDEDLRAARSPRWNSTGRGAARKR
jgi:glycosyltransferase involved in cell wall biosynthesis